MDVIEEDEHGRTKVLDADSSAKGAAAADGRGRGRAGARGAVPLRRRRPLEQRPRRARRRGGDADFRPNRPSACGGACAEFFDEVGELLCYY